MTIVCSVYVLNCHIIFLDCMRTSHLVSTMESRIFLDFRSTIFFLLLVLVAEVQSAKILFLLPLATRSETHLFIPLAKELLKRGHDITYVSPLNATLGRGSPKDVEILPPIDAGAWGISNPPVARKLNSNINILKFLLVLDPTFMYEGCRAVFEHTEFQRILQQESFDLVIINGDFNNCLFGVVHKFQAPYILLSSLPVFRELARVTGLYLPPSFVPNPWSISTDKMTFIQRFQNTIVEWIFSVSHDFFFAPECEKVYRHYLGEDTPSLLEIEWNVSMIFSNSFYGVTSPRPMTPDIVEVGGIHCREPKSLSKDLESFVSEAEHGFIYFSLGTVTKGSSLPEEVRKVFLNVFSRLKQRVIWKWETETMPDLPSNVKLMKWIPQQDILGHKNIRLFLTHGGLLSTLEAAYHGVPLIGIPLVFDQNGNMLQAERKGFAKPLEFMGLTEETLESSIHEMLNNSSYKVNAKKVSETFRDQPNSALDRAVFWTEYVIRHEGAQHLRSAARDLNSFQYHSYDVIATVLLIVLIIVFLLFKLIVHILQLLCYVQNLFTYKISDKKLR